MSGGETQDAQVVFSSVLSPAAGSSGLLLSGREAGQYQSHEKSTLVYALSVLHPIGWLREGTRRRPYFSVQLFFVVETPVKVSLRGII